MQDERDSGRWTTRRIVVVLVAAGAAYLLAVGGLVGVVVSRGIHAYAAATSGSSADTAPTGPTPRSSDEAPSPQPSPSGGPSAGTEAPPAGPLTRADAEAALRSYDSRNAAAITARTRTAWSTVDLQPILAEDLWSDRAQAAAKKAGHPFAASGVPTTTLVRLLGSGDSGGGQWFAAVVTFGPAQSADTFVGVYLRSSPTAPFRLSALDYVNSDGSVPPTGDPTTWSGTPQSGAETATQLVRYLTSGTPTANMDVDPNVDSYLGGASTDVATVEYSCPTAPTLGPASVPLTTGRLGVADITCTRTSTAVSGRTFTYNSYDAAILGKSPSLTRLDCPTVASIVFVARPDGGTDVIGAFDHQTGVCTGTGGTTPGTA